MPRSSISTLNIHLGRSLASVTTAGKFECENFEKFCLDEFGEFSLENCGKFSKS